MAAQCVGFSLLLLSCLLALASPAPLSPVTSPELKDGDELLSKTLNLVSPLRPLELRPFDEVDADDLAPLSGDVEDRTPLADDVEEADTAKSYVDASVFRKNGSPADAVKPKPSFFVKKTISTFDKKAKKGREMKADVSVPSDKLEPPVVDTEVESTTSSPSIETDASATPSETSMTSSGTHEYDELPRLSPPIWLHSSLAEAMSDPLRLPMIEPYDRYDRYSHSIARDSLW